MSDTHGVFPLRLIDVLEYYSKPHEFGLDWNFKENNILNSLKELLNFITTCDIRSILGANISHN